MHGGKNFVESVPVHNSNIKFSILLLLHFENHSRKLNSCAGIVFLMMHIMAKFLVVDKT